MTPDFSYDPCALVGASFIMLVWLVGGALSKGTFRWVYLLDAIPGAIGGALLVPGLADIPKTDPCWERLVAAAILALGVKGGMRALVKLFIK